VTGAGPSDARTRTWPYRPAEPLDGRRMAARSYDGDRPTMGLPAVLDLGDGTVTDLATIGVSIGIPEPWGSQIEAFRESFGDPVAGSVPAHVTLLPPTAVPVLAVPNVNAHLEWVARHAEPFDLALGGSDSFRPVSPVVFLKVVRGAPGCDALQQSVRTGPLVRDLAFPYHPHVTVAHRVDDAALDRALTTLADFSARFTVTGFCLYEHGADGVWRAKHRFGLGGA